MQKKLRSKLLLSFLGIFMSLIFVEIFLRFTQPFTLVPHFTKPSTLFGFEHIPGARGTYQSSEYKIKVSINKAGLREDNETLLIRKQGVKRVALIGDSFVEGLQVDSKKVVSKKLEELLNVNTKDSKYEVLNFGVSGYGMD